MNEISKKNSGQSSHDLPSRIGRRLIIYLVSLSTVITLVITAFQLYEDYRHEVGIIDERFALIEHANLKTLSHAVWTTSQYDISLQLAGLMRMPDIQYVAVREDNDVVVSMGEKQQKSTISKTFPLDYNHRGVRYTIGYLDVVATLDRIYQRLIDKVWVILLSNAVKTFLVAGFMLLVFYKLVTRHLHDLATQVESVALDNLRSPVKLDRTKKHDNKQDELDVLASSFDRMRLKMAAAVEGMKQREKELMLFEVIMNTSTDLIAFVDRNYIYRAVNKSFCDFFDKNPTEVIGRSSKDLLGSDMFFSIVKPRLDQVLNGQQMQYVTTIQNNHDEEMFVEVNYHPYYGGEQRVQGVVVNIRNVSARVQIDRDNERHKRVYEALAQQSFATYEIFLKNTLSLLQEMFDSCYAFAGRLLPDGKHVVTECVLKDTQQLKNFVYEIRTTPCEHAFDHKKNLIYEDVIGKYPEDELIVDMEAETYFGVPLISSNGDTIGIIAVLDTRPHQPESWHENTLSVFAARIALEMERYDALKQLEEYNEELESIVAARTEELKNSVSDLETFSYSVSHDLRTPLRAINGYSQILLEDLSDNLAPESLEHLQRIRTASETMGDLIDNLLRLSRIGRQPLDVQKIDLAALGTEAFNQYSDGLEKKPAFVLHNNLDGYGDPGLVRIVLDNLIGNAIKYSANNPEPRIELGMLNDGKENIYYIKDNGVGFNEQYKEKLFKPFQRLHDDPKFQGTGIGLATVKRIINRHGGRVWAESHKNEGAVFYFTLGPESRYEVA